MIEIKYDKEIIENHSQRYPISCIPSCVEMVLKLLEKVNSDYYELQNDWGNNSLGNFKDFDNKTIKGITFHHKFDPNGYGGRSVKFPLNDLSKRIDAELENHRFVCISLVSNAGWHMWVIYKKDIDEYFAFSKENSKTITCDKVWSIVQNMQGTDILTYTI